MHELSIAKNIIQIARDHLTPDEEPRLTKIKVNVGSFTSIVPAQLLFGFEAAREETPFDGAELDITLVPLQIKCNACGHEAEIDPIDFFCPSCSSSDVQIVAGDELTITDLEISDP